MHAKPCLSELSFHKILKDIKSNTGIITKFQENAENTYKFLAREMAHNLGFYIEYVKIFVEDYDHCHELVQNAFTRALEYTEDFDTLKTTQQNPKDIILSYIQEQLETEKNTLYLIDKTIRDNDAAHTETTEDAHYRLKISEEVASVFQNLTEEEQTTVLNYMFSTNKNDLSEKLKQIFKNNKFLSSTYNGNVSNNLDNNTPTNT